MSLFFFPWICWLNRLIFALGHTWDFTCRITMGRNLQKLNRVGHHGFFTLNRYLHVLQVVFVSSTIARNFSCHIKIWWGGDRRENHQISKEYVQSYQDITLVFNCWQYLKSRLDSSSHWRRKVKKSKSVIPFIE